MSTRGEHLVHADRGFATGGGAIARLVSPAFSKLLDEIHANLPFGQGETPIKQVLLLLKTSKWKIPANIEYEYRGADAIVEVKKCYQFMKDALA